MTATTYADGSLIANGTAYNSPEEAVKAAEALEAKADALFAAAADARRKKAVAEEARKAREREEARKREEERKRREREAQRSLVKPGGLYRDKKDGTIYLAVENPSADRPRAFSMDATPQGPRLWRLPTKTEPAARALGATHGSLAYWNSTGVEFEPLTVASGQALQVDGSHTGPRIDGHPFDRPRF